MSTTKITKATLKSFIKKNIDKLYINPKSSFSGMTDMVEDNPNQGFRQVKPNNDNMEYTYGVPGLWVVSGSRNIIEAYKDEMFTGFEVYNCCGCSIVAIKNFDYEG